MTKVFVIVSDNDRQFSRALDAVVSSLRDSGQPEDANELIGGSLSAQSGSDESSRSQPCHVFAAADQSKSPWSPDLAAPTDDEREWMWRTLRS
jgi:hypothetical protein